MARLYGDQAAWRMIRLIQFTWKATHRIAAIHLRVRLATAALTEATVTEFLFDSPRVPREGRIDPVYMYWDLVWSQCEPDWQSRPPSSPICSPRSDLSIMSKSVVSTLGATLIGTNIAGVCVLFPTKSVRCTDDEANRCIDSPVLYVRRC